MSDKHSIVEYLYEHSVNRPNKTAIVGLDGTIGYAALWNAIKDAASMLQALGIKKGDRILLEASHTVEYLVCSFGIQLAGAVHVTLERNAPPVRAEEIAADTQCSMTLTGTHPYTDLKRSFENREYGIPASVSFPAEDMLQEIMFTTGTTGKSKGVMLTHGACVFRCFCQINGFSVSDDAVWLIPSPMNHAAGLRRSQAAMINGNTLVLVDGFTDLKYLFEALEKYQVTELYLPPAGIHYILALASRQLAKFDGQLRHIFSSSSVLSVGDKTKMNSILPHVRKSDGYGSSETGSIGYTDYSTEDIEVGCVGKPFDGYEYIIVDEQHRPMDATREDPGIISVRGKGLASGYWNEPELTARTFIDGCIYMSDMGYLQDGALYLVGRKDDVINVGGLKVAPLEVEEVARSFPAVNECVCVPYEDQFQGRVVKMFVTVQDGCTLDDTELLKFMGEALEAYKLPKKIEHLQQLPRTYNGKIDRKKLIGQ